MSVELLELAAARLGELLDELVFVGGATVGLWITDPAAPEFRPTYDVDSIVEVSGREAYQDLERRLQSLGLRHDQESGVMCRFRDDQSDLILDVMPTDASILGFKNEWQTKAFPNAVPRVLPSGVEIAVVPPPFLLASKLEAFRARGQGDLLGSKDMSDIVALIDGREELFGEVAEATEELRSYVSAELRALAGGPPFDLAVAAHLKPDPSSQERADLVVVPRIEQLVRLGAS